MSKIVNKQAFSLISHIYFSVYSLWLPWRNHCLGKNAKLPGYMDYLHLSTSDVGNLKESWSVLEDNVSKVSTRILYPVLFRIPRNSVGRKSVFRWYGIFTKLRRNFGFRYIKYIKSSIIIFAWLAMYGIVSNVSSGQGFKVSHIE